MKSKSRAKCKMELFNFHHLLIDSFFNRLTYILFLIYMIVAESVRKHNKDYQLTTHYACHVMFSRKYVHHEQADSSPLTVLRAGNSVTSTGSE